MDQRQRAINAIGIVVRSKKFVFGERLLENLEKINLVIVVRDIAPNSLKRINNKAAQFATDVHVLDLSSKELEFITKIKNIKAIGITDSNHKVLLVKHIPFLSILG